MTDDTRLLRNTQANLIHLQAIRIVALETRSELLEKRVAELEAENKRLKATVPTTGVKEQAQA